LVKSQTVSYLEFFKGQAKAENIKLQNPTQKHTQRINVNFETNVRDSYKPHNVTLVDKSRE